MRIREVPVFVVFVGALGAAMAGPALFAAVEADWRSARLFLFAGLFVTFLAAILGAASRGRASEGPEARAELLTLFAIFAAGPVFAAMPIALVAPELGWGGALFEATSSLTTTGATLLDPPEAAPRALHLWRALLGWIGGFATLTAAAAILSPRELLDLPGQAAVRAEAARGARALPLGPGGRRVMRAAAAIGPVYIGFTAVATAALSAPGGSTFAAFCHAMGLVSTSGISPLAQGFSGQGGRWAEAAAVLFMVLAATRLTYAPRMPGARYGAASGVLRDPELWLMALAVGVAATWLVLRGFWEAGGAEPARALRAAWGAAFTSVSFLTTTGYVSADWPETVRWTNYREAPGLLLIGLATLGGGVATTAGGVKLFRAYALFRHGAAELARLPHPDMVDQTATAGGRLSRRAIVNAWVVLMLYLAAFGLTMTAMTLAGLKFGTALAAAAAALSNAGPLLNHASEARWSTLPPGALAAAGAAMALGRIELLAAVALLNPAYWGR